MSSDAQITELLDRLKKTPKDAPTLQAVAELYLDASTTNEQRELIRQAISKLKDVRYGYVMWNTGFKDTDPLRHLRLRLAVYSLTDGAPDPRDAWLEVQWLKGYAVQNDVDYDKQAAEIGAISSARVYHLFTGNEGLNLKLWLG